MIRQKQPRLARPKISIPSDNKTYSRKGWVRWFLAGGAGALAVSGARKAEPMRAVSPELRAPLLLLPMTLSRLTTPVFRYVQETATRSGIPDGVRKSERLIEQSDGAPPVRLVIFEREKSSELRPALLWMHGGGFVIGSPEQDIALVGRILGSLDVAIVSVDYALVPEHPFPRPLDDCHHALKWLVEHAAELRVDPDRIGIGGQSAGGGLAAALVQKAVDQGPVHPAFQLLIYPMLDASTCLRPDDGTTGRFVWNRKSNRYAWRSYLGHDPASVPFMTYAVPAARADLARLPPTWIGVGTLDLFHEEDAEYGRRLKLAGVDCDIYIVDRAYHGFDVLKPDAVATSEFYSAMLNALAGGLGCTSLA